MIKNFRVIILILFVAAFTVTFHACDGAKDVPEWEWPDPDPEPDPEPDPDPDPDPEPDPDTTAVVLKPRFIWIDACANFPDYANSKENIAIDLQKVKDAGFTDIVVDVRPTMGDVLFSSSYVDEVKKLDVWNGPSYEFYERTATWDYLQAFIDAGHELGLNVNAAINTFVGGNKYPYGLGEQGMLFRDPSKKEWATTISYGDGLYNVMDVDDDSYGTKFLNPVNTEVQNFVLNLLSDLARYDLDGIFLDRCRFDDLSSDFSDYTVSEFEKYISENIGDVPSDIADNHYKKWLEFRVKTIHDFVEKASNTVHGVNRNIRFGTYVGGWYSSYYDVGVNWASPEYNTASKYPTWATADYKNYGYADHLDYILIGAYASATSIYGSSEWTCQGFCKCADKVLLDAVPYAGGPDVGNWNTAGCSDIGKAVTNTVDACINSSDGYFVFDIIHVKMYDYWDELKAGIDKYIESASKK